MTFWNLVTGGAKTILDYVVGAIIEIFLNIDSVIYWFAGQAYEVFYAVASTNLFDSDVMNTIIDRIYVVLGVGMLFVFAYNILLLIINPDDLASKSEKSLSSLAKNLVISIVLLAVLKPAFNYMAVLQNNILKSNVIEKIILSSVTDPEAFKKNAGRDAAVNAMHVFLYPIDADGNPIASEDKCNGVESCINYFKFTNYYVEHGEADFSGFGYYIASKQMAYHIIISSIAGVIFCYYYLSFAFDIAVRIGKLAFLQIIAPIPVVLRITKPKGGVFSKWLSNLGKTYMELFVRVFTIYFVMFAIGLVPDIFSNLGNDGSNIIVKFLAILIVILGLLKFGKDAPKMAEDLFGMEHLELSLEKKLGEVPVVGKPIAHGISQAKGFVGGAAGGAVLGMQEGIRSGDFSNTKKYMAQGAANGGKSGGFDQVFKQRRAIYDSYNPNKELGLFGGDSLMQQYKDKHGKDAKNAVNEDRQNYVHDTEMTDNFEEAFSKVLDEKEIKIRRDKFQDDDIFKNASAMADQYCQANGISRNDPRYNAILSGYLNDTKEHSTDSRVKRKIATYMRDSKIQDSYNQRREQERIIQQASKDKFDGKINATTFEEIQKNATAKINNINNTLLTDGKTGAQDVFLGKSSIDDNGGSLEDTKYKDAIKKMKATEEFNPDVLGTSDKLLYNILNKTGAGGSSSDKK